MVGMSLTVLLLSVDCHQHGRAARVVVVGLHLLRRQGVHLLLGFLPTFNCVIILIDSSIYELIYLCNFKKYHLGVSLQYFLCNLGMVEDNLLVPHLLDGVVSVALHGVVVLRRKNICNLV